jgi:hypothetical protein
MLRLDKFYRETSFDVTSNPSRVLPIVTSALTSDRAAQNSAQRSRFSPEFRREKAASALEDRSAIRFVDG